MSGLSEVRRDGGTFIRGLRGSRIIRMVRQSQLVLWFSTWALHGGVQWLGSWPPKTPPTDGSQGTTCLASPEVRYRSEKTSGLGSNEHKPVFAFQEESKLDWPWWKSDWTSCCFVTEGTVLPQGVRDQMTEGLVVVYGDLRLFLAFVWRPAQATEHWYNVLPARTAS